MWSDLTVGVLNSMMGFDIYLRSWSARIIGYSTVSYSLKELSFMKWQIHFKTWLTLVLVTEQVILMLLLAPQIAEIL